MPAMQETQGMQLQSLGEEDLLKKKVATHSSILAVKIHGQRSLMSYGPWGLKDSNMTQHACTCGMVRIRVGARELKQLSQRHLDEWKKGK